MKKQFLSIFLLAIFSCVNGQKLKNNLFQDENSATTENKLTTAKKNIDQAFVAYSENNLEKSKYFIDQSQKQGVKTADFYFMLGAYMYRTKELKAAKRYWKIAYKEGGCWECKELLEKLENDKNVEEDISQKVKTYLEKK